jgi:hypothetical protein
VSSGTSRACASRRDGRHGASSAPDRRRRTGRHLEIRADAAAPDPRSWPSLSQRGELADVVAHLAAANLATIDVSRVAWRLRDRAAYDAIVGALEARCAFDAALWGYALLHRDPPRIRTWLRARAADLAAAGPVLDMIELDAQDLGSYEHLELAPLINARAHRLGARVRILNDGLAAQYTRFLDLVAHRRAPTPDDLLAATHYLLAQDRVPPRSPRSPASTRRRSRAACSTTTSPPTRRA